jgi:hypothetical protein
MKKQIKQIKKTIKGLWQSFLAKVGVRYQSKGRVINFDERSRAHRVFFGGIPAGLKTKIWDRPLPPLDQGSLGSCTGNAVVGLLATEPFRSDGVRDDVELIQSLAIEIYSRATVIDPFEGHYPPTDTGSSVLSAMKIAKSMGLIKEYRWCIGFDDVLRTLSHVGPVVVGVTWYRNFNRPDCNGLVKIGGPTEGGHAFQLIGIDVEKKLVWAVNSWGNTWGEDGRFCISFDDIRTLLNDRGEAVTAVI